MRKARSFTIDRDIDEYVIRTRGGRSTSERVNNLLRRGMRQEQQDEIEREAAEFFAHPRNSDRKGARALQKTAKRTLARD